MNNIEQLKSRSLICILAFITLLINGSQTFQYHPSAPAPRIILPVHAAVQSPPPAKVQPVVQYSPLPNFEIQPSPAPIVSDSPRLVFPVIENPMPLEHLKTAPKNNEVTRRSAEPPKISAHGQMKEDSAKSHAPAYAVVAADSASKPTLTTEVAKAKETSKPTEAPHSHPFKTFFHALAAPFKKITSTTPSSHPNGQSQKVTTGGSGSSHVSYNQTQSGNYYNSPQGNNAQQPAKASQSYYPTGKR